MPHPRPQPVRAGGEAADLIDFLKEWRRRTAQRLSVPAYVVLSDAAIEDLCRKQPTNLRELLAVNGFGERKAELYGSEIFSAFEAFRKGARAAAREVAQVSPAEETLRLLAEGKSFAEIATIRGRQPSTVINMVADLVEKGRVEYDLDWVGAENHAAHSGSHRIARVALAEAAAGGLAGGNHLRADPPGGGVHAQGKPSRVRVAAWRGGSI